MRHCSASGRRTSRIPAWLPAAKLRSCDLRLRRQRRRGGKVLACGGGGERDDGSHVILCEAWKLAENHVCRFAVREIAKDHTNEYAGSPDDGLAAANGWVADDAVVVSH